MSDGLQQTLESLTSGREEWDYLKTGIHHCHAATVETIVDVARAFLDAGYMFEMLTCLDMRADDERIRLCYTFNSLENVDRHLVHVDIAGGMETTTFEAPTISSVASGANWQEREAFEMYGVTFTGHPELERLLLPEDADFFPLRKDFGRIEDAEESDE